ncbi:molybdopterin converting factor subunit 1 [Methylosoma difficile]
MSIKVRYFASLKESLGRTGDDVAFVSGLTVRTVWQQANPEKPLPDNILAAVNMEYVELDEPVEDTDEVAFFPPVTGG